MRTRRRAIVGLSLILLSASLFAARSFWLFRTRSPLTELAAAVGSELPFEPRLTGGFLPRSESSVRRGGTSARDGLSPDARIAIARLEKQASNDESSTLLGALGVAFLVEGNVDRSIATLEDVTSTTEDSSQWSDLSAAYLVKAEAAPARRIEYLARGLEAAARSLRIRPSNEARFNRALALQRLSPYVGDTNAWDEYLTTERDTRWIATARRHLANATSAANLRAPWEDRKKMLRERLTDHAFVTETIKLFPEATFEFFDQELLMEWARAEASLDTGRAKSALQQARAIAEAIFITTQDGLARDTVASVDALSRGSTSSKLRQMAAAHLSYSDAVAEFRAFDYPKAMTSVDCAVKGFEETHSPYEAWARLQKATILFQQRDLSASGEQLAAVEKVARARRYQSLLGRALRQRGLTQSKQWRLTEALQAFREAAACFETSGEQERALDVYSLIADALRSLGEHQESWEYIGKTLQGLGRVRTPLRRYLILFNASLFASSQDLFDAALLFQNAAVHEATIRGGGPVVEALIQRATILVRRKEREQALGDLQSADARLHALPEGPLKRYHQAQIDVLISELGAPGHVPPRVDGLEQAIGFFSTAEPALVPRLYLSLARTNLAARSEKAAEDAFAQGIAYLEGQQARLGDEALKISYFDESWNLFPEMIDLQATVRRDVSKAFEYAERSRARSLLAVASATPDARPLGLQAIQSVLPTAVVLVYYVTLSDRLLIWTVNNAGYRLVETRITRADLTQLVSRYRSALIDEHATASGDSERLHNALIRPIRDAFVAGSTLVFVPDGDLQRLPFATLHDPRTGRYLIEDHPVLMSPSASFFAAGLLRSRQFAAKRIESALLVGNPSSGASVTELKPLMGAEVEAKEAAAFYPRHDVLTGTAATKSRFVQSAPNYDVVHFGGHAFVNVEFPLLSRLSLSPDFNGGPPQSLFAHEISQLRFDRTRLVVLAACSTAVGAVSRGEGVVSVARPFLAAGVPVVIASQWDVDDRATEQLFLAFHRSLITSQDPVIALRNAQLSLLRSERPQLAAPRSWGAFLALGTAAH